MTNKLILTFLLVFIFSSCGKQSDDSKVIKESEDFGKLTIEDTIKIEYELETSETVKLENDIIHFEFSPKPGDLKYLVNGQEVAEKKYSIPINDLGDKLIILVLPTESSIEEAKNLKINIYSSTIDDLIVDDKNTNQLEMNVDFKYNIPWPAYLTILVWVGIIILIFVVIIMVSRFTKLKLQRGSIEFNNNTIRFNTSYTKLVIGNKDTIQKPTFMESLLGEKYEYKDCGISNIFGFVIEPKLSGKRKYNAIGALKYCNVQDGSYDLRSDSSIKIVSDNPVEIDEKDKKNIFLLSYNGISKED